jgi:hypothetical protein
MSTVSARRRERISDAREREPKSSEASGKSARKLHGHDPSPKRPQLAGCRVLGVLRRKQRNPDFARLHEVRDPRVAQ